MNTAIQCNVDVLSNKELTPNVRQKVKHIIEKEGFKTYKINVKNISTCGGNYMGTLQTVSINGKTKNGDDKELNLFLKNIKPIDDSFSIFNASQAYLREAYVYNELFKIFDKIQDKYEIPQKERFNIVKSYSESNNKVTILEDLSKLGYKTYDRLKVVPLKFAELATEQLGKLHAISFIIKKEDPKYFENNVKTLHSLFHLTNDYAMYLRKSCDKVKETLDSDVQEKIDKFYSTMMEKYEKWLIVSADEAVCLTHIEYRPDNILVKETNGEATAAIPVDYQLLQYGSPVIDFLYFIFVGTDQKFRKRNLENLKNLYYNTFENFLSKFGIDAKDVYSRKQFEDDYREKLDYGLMSFISTLPFVYSKNESVPELEHGLQSASFDLEDCHKYRLHGIVDDFIKWGYL